MFDDKTILITGGTGSFGRQCVEMLLARYSPRKLIIFSRDEYKQFEMRQRFDAPCMRYFLGDVRDRERLALAFTGVDYIIHAAALKQVPALEYNPDEAIKTNIIGAENVIHCALAQNVQQVIALSTDKAAAPINLYGATKLVSDKLFVAANNLRGRHLTRFSVVRYGNVLGSRGSVVPFFRRLIEQGAQHLPVTDKRMTRFCITLEEGVEFVLKAFQRMQGGEIFVPKIPSVGILTVVEAMRPGIGVEVVGIRPGEKLHEVMCPADSSLQTLEFSDHYLIQPAFLFSEPVSFEVNALNESGVPVTPEFEYNSRTNGVFLDAMQLRMLIERQCLWPV